MERPRDDEAVGSAAVHNQIASRVQSSILAKELELDGLGVSAGMLPAEIVGGDYYDVVAIQDGCWIATGDVEGHGLTAGIIMLMIQSTVQSLVKLSPKASPRDLLCALNAVLYENIRERMKGDEHVTLCLARYSADGALVFAGAREKLLICRADGRDFHVSAPEGLRLGAIRDIRQVTSETTLHLAPGDLMVLFTDGVIEARNEKGEEFGAERLREKLTEVRKLPPQQLRMALMDAVLAWNPRPADDITLVVVVAADGPR